MVKHDLMIIQDLMVMHADLMTMQSLPWDPK